MAYSIFVVLLLLSLRATLPIFCMAKRKGRRAGFSLYGLAFFVARGNYLTFSPVPENRGETLGTFVPKVRG